MLLKHLYIDIRNHGRCDRILQLLVLLLEAGPSFVALGRFFGVVVLSFYQYNFNKFLSCTIF